MSTDRERFEAWLDVNMPSLRRNITTLGDEQIEIHSKAIAWTAWQAAVAQAPATQPLSHPAPMPSTALTSGSVDSQEARERSSGQDAWQPIETAPKDGTSVLLFTAQGMIEGYFEHGEWEQAVCAASYDMAHAYIECKPTLWQPLPDQSPRPQSGTDGEVR